MIGLHEFEKKLDGIANLNAVYLRAGTADDLSNLAVVYGMADLLLEMSDALNSGYMKPLESRSAPAI